MYECETEGVWIRVEPDYLDEESEPDEGRFVWAYTIEIENRGEATLQLVSREWEITDSRGRIEIVRGDGVVGARGRRRFPAGRAPRRALRWVGVRDRSVSLIPPPTARIAQVVAPAASIHPRGGSRVKTPVRAHEEGPACRSPSPSP